MAKIGMEIEISYRSPNGEWSFATGRVVATRLQDGGYVTVELASGRTATVPVALVVAKPYGARG